MRNDERHGWSGILGRLRRDKRGNALAIMAASLIPLMGFSGAAVDMARLYIVKVRLQQACDAGVLAGRKVMTDTAVSTPLDPAAKTQAATFFANNFRSGYLRSTAVDFKPVKAASGTDTTVANAVTGTASATVPMAVMGFFGSKPVKMDVTCQAVFDLADTDVMFVLDTTGSMACLPSDPASCSNGPTVSYKRSDGTTGWYNPEKSGSKMQALRDAVILFDSTMRGNADPSTHFRYGFVTYSSTVNVGRLIPAANLATEGTYQTRYLSPDVPNIPEAIAGDYAYGAPSSTSRPNIPKAYCVAQRSPATGFTRTGLTWNDEGFYQARAYYNLSWTAANGGTCSGTQQALRAMWRYGAWTWPTKDFVASHRDLNNAEALNPTRLDGSTDRWRGCIEEPLTTTDSTFDVNNLPQDLDPDAAPTGKLGWRPAWPDVVWNREVFGTQDVKDENVVKEAGLSRNVPPWPGGYYPWYLKNYGGGAFYDDTGSAACGMKSYRLKTWTAQEVKNYVNDPDFKAYGGTYHDVGMIWGTRLLSPDGIFGADTAPWPGRKAPSRNIVFMTDGTMLPTQTSYGLYGVELWDNRTGGQNDTTRDYNNHVARFRVECDAAKAKGYTIYVVAVGVDINADLTYCASPGQTFEASSTDELTDAFKQIAQRVAMLRITL